MRILFIADGRSPITLNWLRYWLERGDEVYLVSTFPCAPNLSLKGLEILPVAFAGMRIASSGEDNLPSMLRGARTLRLRSTIQQILGPLTLPRAAQRLYKIVEQIQPNVVHAMRIPFEGMLAMQAKLPQPLIVSVWGNDFTLHARSTPLMAASTRRVMARADALHVDCQRDARLAYQWGFNKLKPVLVIPGNGGVRLDIFFPPKKPESKPVILNPRGFRAYVRNDTFFRSIPFIIEKRPDASFRCVRMAAEGQALNWLQKLNITQWVELLPARTHDDMADLYRNAQILVSPSTHDGTPNSLLEGMACGCLPVASDLESIREWITPGLNGLLANPLDPRSFADAILSALDNKVFRLHAIKENARLIAKRAEYQHCMGQAETFYRQVIAGNSLV